MNCKRNAIAFVLITALFGFNNLSNAQSLNPWNNHQCAVVLTYDDGLNVHLDYVIPFLDSLGLRGTFYIPGNSPTLNNRIEDWRAAAKTGHELGNHTLFHPCNGAMPGREWVNKNYDLSNYTLTRMMDEITVANNLLKAIDGKEQRTFAYTCGDLNAGSESFFEPVKKEVAGGRSVVFRYESLQGADIYNLGAYMIAGQSADEMIIKVKEAMTTHSLLVFLFHGVGGEHNINVSLEEHNKLVQFLKDHEQEIWVAPLIEVSQFISSGQQK
jgi:sialate O-acetylesterase